MRKHQLRLMRRGMCIASSYHGPAVAQNLCYQCILNWRNRYKYNMSSPIPDHWPISCNFGHLKHKRVIGFIADVRRYWDKTEPLPWHLSREFGGVEEEWAYFLYKENLITPQQLDHYLAMDLYQPPDEDSCLSEQTNPSRADPASPSRDQYCSSSLPNHSNARQYQDTN